MAEPPSLPYARDAGSTSHAAAHQFYPTFADTFEAEEEEEEEVDGSVDADSARETQYWAANRHKAGRDETEKEEEHSELFILGGDFPKLMVVAWRLRSRLKTFNCGMFICLNIGVDPPDVVKTNPCAKLECWLDPSVLPSSKAIDAIGRSMLTYTR